jgi:hypothetical protein
MNQNETINDALARAETAEEERDRLRVSLKNAVERAEAAERNAIAAMAPTVSGKDAQAWAEEVAALTAKLKAAKDRADMLERDAAESRTKLNALSALIRGGVSALIRG